MRYGLDDDVPPEMVPALYILSCQLGDIVPNPITKVKPLEGH